MKIIAQSMYSLNFSMTGSGKLIELGPSKNKKISPGMTPRAALDSGML
jgi:hypothetical protein